MKRWKITGIIAGFVIVVLIPLYAMRSNNSKGRAVVASTGAAFVGSEECKDCHRPEYDKWRTSHHRMAMAVASQETVLGDFDNAVFEYFGTKSVFYRKGSGFFVRTQGPGGNMGDFEITHTFGWFPLQQYLVPFPGGRMQCLPIAWDDIKKQWYHLSPDQQIEPTDWLYWTRNAQNWNGMCAECHSTNLVKGYDMISDTYQTSWSEISIGCEACHGPGSQHVSWAKMPDMGRPHEKNFALTVKTNRLSARQQIELCAPCHARRSSMGDNPHRLVDFMDYGIPRLLTEGLYFADGQILDEVYVYSSFMQSKMYARDVRCSDCHDVHSIRRIEDGNALCLQCHKAAEYDSKDHHFHKKRGEKGDAIRDADGEILFDVGSGAQCEQCHMPGRHYMGIDYRPDHSFRIPRPDLSTHLGTPNACNRCHHDKSNEWSQEYMVKWYGTKQRPHYGSILAAGREHQPDALDGLVKLTGDRLYPAIVRATVLEQLAAYEDEKSRLAFTRALTDEEAIMRQTAVRRLSEPNPLKMLNLLSPLLYDPVKAVRIEAAQRLTILPSEMITGDLREKFKGVLAEYRKAAEYTGDFAASRHNLGNMYANLGQTELAVTHYRKAIEIDDLFYPAKVNLAGVYNRIGRNSDAEVLLRAVVKQHPDLSQIKYSLALLLAEEKKYEDAEVYLKAAVSEMPQHARAHYNLGLLQQQLGRDSLAEISLMRAVKIEPDNIDYLYALADFYLKRGRWERAREIAQEMITRHPNQKIGHDITDFIRRQK